MIPSPVSKKISTSSIKEEEHLTIAPKAEENVDTNDDDICKKEINSSEFKNTTGDKSDDKLYDLKVWREVHYHLTTAIILSNEAIVAEKSKKEYLTNLLCSNLTPEGIPVSTSSWVNLFGSNGSGGGGAISSSSSAPKKKKRKGGKIGEEEGVSKSISDLIPSLPSTPLKDGVSASVSTTGDSPGDLGGRKKKIAPIKKRATRRPSQKALLQQLPNVTLHSDSNPSTIAEGNVYQGEDSIVCDDMSVIAAATAAVAARGALAQWSYCPPGHVSNFPHGHEELDAGSGIGGGVGVTSDIGIGAGTGISTLPSLHQHQQHQQQQQEQTQQKILHPGQFYPFDDGSRSWVTTTTQSLPSAFNYRHPSHSSIHPQSPHHHQLNHQKQQGVVDLGAAVGEGDEELLSEVGEEKEHHHQNHNLSSVTAAMAARLGNIDVDQSGNLFIKPNPHTNTINSNPNNPNINLNTNISSLDTKTNASSNINDDDGINSNNPHTVQHVAALQAQFVISQNQQQQQKRPSQEQQQEKEHHQPQQLLPLHHPKNDHQSHLVNEILQSNHHHLHHNPYDLCNRSQPANMPRLDDNVISAAAAAAMALSITTATVDTNLPNSGVDQGGCKANTDANGE